jgi:hypothetical protein
VALLIASVKATLVGTWFMHLKYEKAFNISFFLGALLFMAIFFGYTSNDTGWRGRVDGINGTQQDARTGAYAAGSASRLRAGRVRRHSGRAGWPRRGRRQ